jgi:hypothetical protein
MRRSPVVARWARSGSRAPCEGPAVDYQAEDSPRSGRADRPPGRPATAGGQRRVSGVGRSGGAPPAPRRGNRGAVWAHGGEPSSAVPEDAAAARTRCSDRSSRARGSRRRRAARVHAALPGSTASSSRAGTLRLALGRWHSTITADRDLQEGDVGRGDAVGRIDVGLARTDELLQARGNFERSVPGSFVAPRGYGGLYDLDATELLWHGPTLRYVSPCGCLTAGASAVWSIDQTGPAAALPARAALRSRSRARAIDRATRIAPRRHGICASEFVRSFE